MDAANAVNATRPPAHMAFVAAVALVLLAAGVVGSVLGAQQVDWRAAWPWQPGAFARYAATMLVLGTLVALGHRYGRLHPGAIAAALALAIPAAAGFLGPALLVLAFALASSVLGRRLRLAWGDRGGDALVDLAVGTGAYGTLASVLAHGPLLRDATCLALIVAPLVLDPAGVRAQLRAAAVAARHATPGAGAWLAATLAALYAVVALFPETGWDALVMHVLIPAHIDAHARWTFDATRYVWAVMPALVDFVYAIVYVPGGGETAARLLNAGAVVVVAALVARLATRAGAAPRWSDAAAALLLATPVAFTLGSSLFIDATWTAFVVAGVVALAAPRTADHVRGACITAGALFGFATAAKAVTLPMLPVLALAGVLLVRRHRRSGLGAPVALAALAFVMAGAKPYLTAWLLTGNPIYPFYVHVFGGPAFDWWRSGPGHYPGSVHWRTLYDVTFASQRFIEGRPGAAGFQWLTVLPAALATLLLRRARGGLALAALGAALVLAVFVFTAYLRYAMPGIALLVAALAVAGSVVGEHRAYVQRAFVAVLALVTVANLLVLNAAGFAHTFPLATLRGESGRDLAREHDAPASVAGAAAQRLPSTGPRLAYFAAPTFAASPRLHGLHPSWYSPPFERDLRGAATPEDLARILLDWNSPLVVVEPGTREHERFRASLDAATQIVAQWPRAELREVRPALMFALELVVNADFAQRDGWELLGQARHDAVRRSVRVTEASPARQAVPVRPGGSYLNTVRALCAPGRSFRLQVNWADSRGAFLGTALRPVACTGEWVEGAQRLVAPARAAMAIVYATAAGDAPVEIGLASLRSHRR